MLHQRKISLSIVAAAGVIVLAIITLLALSFTSKEPQGLLGASPTHGATTAPTATQAPTAMPTLPPTPTPDIVDGYQLYINPDHSFSVRYPRSWRQTMLPRSSGQGVSFDSLAADSPSFIVSNLGPSASSPDAFIASYCASGRGKLGPTMTVLIGGQQWIQAECNTTDGPGHFAIEAVVYQGSLYFISYGSFQSTFDENRATYFTRMEQSFAFLS